MIITRDIINSIEDNLYIYPRLEREIKELEEIKENTTNKDINSYIKSKGIISKGVENQAIKNIMIDKKIEIYFKWGKIIDNIITEYKELEMEKFLYIKLKYFKNYSYQRIEQEMALSPATQSRIRRDILNEILLFAYKENLVEIKLNNTNNDYIKNIYAKIFS